MDIERKPFSKRTKRDRRSMEETPATGSEREPMEEDDEMQLAIQQSMKTEVDSSNQQIILHPAYASSDAPSHAPSDNPRDNPKSYVGDRGSSGGYECPYCSMKFNMKDDMEVQITIHYFLH